MNTPFDIIPGDFVTSNFYDRCANPRAGMLFQREDVRPWGYTPGVHGDVDSGRAASTQTREHTVSECVTVRDSNPAETFLAEANFNRRHARWQTRRGESWTR